MRTATCWTMALMVVVLAGPAPASAQSPTLAGTWQVTQDPGGENFRLATVFAEGGSAHYTDQQNNAGFGVWRKTSGANFAVTFEEFSGGQRLQFRATIQLGGANSFVGTVSVYVLSLDGQTVESFLGSTTLAGTRMVVVPEL